MLVFHSENQAEMFPNTSASPFFLTYLYGIIMLVHAMAQERLVGPRENNYEIKKKQRNIRVAERNTVIDETISYSCKGQTTLQYS